MTASGPAPIRIGVSSCLLGERVRWNGDHKRDAWLTDVLQPFVEWVAVCPEVEMGLGTPRETLRLQQQADGVHLVASRSGTDHSLAMRRWSARRVKQLAKQDLDGYVLKKGSPSCGMTRVRVYSEAGMPVRMDSGMFAAELTSALPDLPVEEEGRLHDAALRESFVERVFFYHRLKAFFAGHWTIGSLVAFHTAQKMQLMAHSPEAYRALGRLVARARDLTRGDLESRYRSESMRALQHRATRRRHTNVLQHMAGHLRKHLSQDERSELAGVIADHHRALVPLVVPITLFRHHVRRHGVGYLAGQTYLEPHPKELMLRNHA